MIYAIKTVAGREEAVLDLLEAKTKIEKLKIKVLVHPEELKSYILVEGELSDIERATKTIPHVKKVLRNAIRLEEIEKFLIPKKEKIEFKQGDIVEVIGGPLKGQKAKVLRFDPLKGEVVIELLEVVVPIQVTVSTELLKLVR